MEPVFPLTVFSDEFGMVKLMPEVPVPDSVLRAPMYFVARTEDELSIVAPIRELGTIERNPGRYRLLRIEQVFGTTESGILKRVVDPLAAAGVWILALGTHDRDYLLIRQDQFDIAVTSLRAAGHSVSD